MGDFRLDLGFERQSKNGGNGRMDKKCEGRS